MRVATASIRLGWFWTEIDLLHERWNVRRHPFNQRWTDGELSEGTLRDYASEYHHAVLAIAAVAKRAAEQAPEHLLEPLRDRAVLERDHVDAWIAFARATGWGPGEGWYFAEEPHEQTVACARAWSGGRSRDLAEHLLTLYAVDLAQTDASRVQLEALHEHYGFDGGRATEYFRCHAADGARHAELSREAFAGVRGGGVPFALLARVEAVYRSYWGLLDGLSAAQPARGAWHVV